MYYLFEAQPAQFLIRCDLLATHNYSKGYVAFRSHIQMVLHTFLKKFQMLKVPARRLFHNRYFITEIIVKKRSWTLIKQLTSDNYQS